MSFSIAKAFFVRMQPSAHRSGQGEAQSRHENKLFFVIRKKIPKAFQ